jgi:hypothetical protein
MDRSWDRIPDAIEPIVAYRLWFYELGEQRAELLPFSSAGAGPRPKKERWACAGARWIVASCLLCFDWAHQAPVEECTCGFYAMDSLTRLIEQTGPLLYVPLGAWLDPGVVLGRVELAGKVIEHEHGYRAERARLVELIPIEGSEASVTRLAHKLGVTVGNPVQLPDHPLDSPPHRPRTTATASPSSPRMRIKEWLQVPGLRVMLALFLLQCIRVLAYRLVS